MSTSNMTETFGFKILKPGILALIQDSGRTGQFNIGLTNGGAMDQSAFNFANQLCSNTENTTAIEISAGGLQLESNCNQVIAVTGANMPLLINNQPKALWQSHKIQSGDTIKLGFATQGLRSYLAVSGGFKIDKIFNSTSTVCREKIGGINGNALKADDFLACNHIKTPTALYYLEAKHQPVYSNTLTLRMILSYQHKQFSDLEKRLFFASEYTVSHHFNRMGYRLTGRKIQANVNGILSEGICHGAVQIPNDGQPIVLLNDRQTIGGYPKIGSVIKLDTQKLAQTGQGARLHFEAISMEHANNLFHLNRSYLQRIKLIKCN